MRTDDVRISPGHALLLAHISRAGPRGLSLDVPATGVAYTVYVYQPMCAYLLTYCYHIGQAVSV